MKKLIFSISTIVVFSWIACSGVSEKVQEAKNAANVINNMEDAAKNIEQSQKEGEAKMAERRKRGDTIAMPYEKLKAFMPTDLQGFTAEGEPEGNFVKQPGMSYSSLKQNYKNGDKTLSVTLTDFNGVAGLYTAAFGLYATGIEIENNDEILKGWNPETGSAKGFEQFRKKSKDANVTVGAGERFVLVVSATAQDNTNAVKAIAKSAKWSEMDKL